MDDKSDPIVDLIEAVIRAARQKGFRATEFFVHPVDGVGFKFKPATADDKSQKRNG